MDVKHTDRIIIIIISLSTDSSDQLLTNPSWPTSPSSSSLKAPNYSQTQSYDQVLSDQLQ